MVGDLIFNGIDFGQWLDVVNIQRSLGPPLSNATLKLTGTNGERFLNQSYGPKTVTVDYQITASSPEDLKNTMLMMGGLLYTRQPARLELVDMAGLNLYELAIAEGATPLEQMLHLGRGSMTFKVLDGTFTSKTKTTTAIPVTLNYLGTASAWPKISITGVTGPVTVTNGANGKKINYTGSLTPGQTLILDHGTQSATIAGADKSSFISLDSNWIDIIPGSNYLLLSSGTGTMEYYAKWL